jgi:hypothetical protein
VTFCAYRGEEIARSESVPASLPVNARTTGSEVIMRHYTKCLILTALLAACDAPTQPGSSDVTTPGPDPLKQHEGVVVRQPISDVFENPCNGELVTVTGEELHVFNGASPDPESGLFTNFEDFFKASGTGLGESGTQYVVSGADHFIFESPSPTAPQVSLTAKGSFLVVSQGGGPNFIEHFTLHITITPDGTIKVTTEFDRAECRG